MTIKNIIYPTPLDDISVNKDIDNIDVFVETDNGYSFTLTVCTPLFYNDYMDRENINYIPYSCPDIIVRKLTYSIIREAIEDYCQDDGCWFKICSLFDDKKNLLISKVDEIYKS